MNHIEIWKDIKEYPGIRESERLTGIDRASISRCCRGKQKHAGGFKWMYKKDYYGIENNG